MALTHPWCITETSFLLAVEIHMTYHVTMADIVNLLFAKTLG